MTGATNRLAASVDVKSYRLAVSVDDRRRRLAVSVDDKSYRLAVSVDDRSHRQTCCKCRWQTCCEWWLDQELLTDLLWVWQQELQTDMLLWLESHCQGSDNDVSVTELKKTHLRNHSNSFFYLYFGVFCVCVCVCVCVSSAKCRCWWCNGILRMCCADITWCEMLCLFCICFWKAHTMHR